ncbi:MAG: penicillin-binding protein activator [Patescibacteria group bacterium]|nr:penicillin-binding protein activator [Patescibacteria group bacterium]
MRKIIWIIIIIIAALFLGWAWGGDDQAPASGEPIRIGVLVPLSGDAAAWGENAKQGIDLALLALREKCLAEKCESTPVELIYEDTRGEARQTVSAYQKLTNIDKVNGIIGPISQTAMASLIPLIEQNPIPVIAPSYVSPEARRNPRNPLLIWTDVQVEAERMAEYVFGQGARSVAILGSLDAWESEVSQAFEQKFKDLGGETSIELVQPNTLEVKTTVTKLLANKPDAVFLGTYYQFINATKTLAEFNFEGSVYGIEVDQYLATETRPRSNGLQFIAPDFYNPNFVDQFEEMYGRKPGIPSGQAYDAASIFFGLWRSAGNKDDVVRAMEDFETHNGVSGEITITPEHITLMPTAIFEVEDGEIIRLEE